MSNRDKIEKVVSGLGYEIGCYDDKLELLSKKELDKVLNNIEFQSDTDVSIKRKLHVVEIDIDCDEVDFSVLSKAEYISRYGDERWDD